MLTDETAATVPFAAHVELLRLFLGHRDQIADRIQGLLNARDRPLQYRQDHPLLSRRFEDCFFTPDAIAGRQAGLRGQLQQTHWAGGFRPREMPGMHNDLADPAQLMIRAFDMWKQTRWPGRNGRVRFAATLFNLYLTRCLELLVMRIWDADPDGADERLAQVQAVLDELWRTSPLDQPVLVRDARWLLPLAQSPTTDDLAPYFHVAEKVCASLTEADQLEIHRATVLMAGGHLRSQLRYYLMKGASLDSRDVVLDSRRSNALDFAMTIQGMVSLLRAYEQQVNGDGQVRLQLAGAICQGISPDPELFVNRLDLLGPYTMIEHLFVTVEEGRAQYTPAGQRHLQLLREYEELIGRLAQPLSEDCHAFKPVRGVYSPYGLMYGFSSNITEHMSLRALLPDSVTRFSIEDAFSEGSADSGKLAWVSGWRKLPHVPQEVLERFEYPQQFAEEIFRRVELALQRRANAGPAGNVPAGRLFISPEGGSGPDGIPDLPIQYVVSSDPRVVAAGQARSCEQSRLLHDRQEGELAVSYPTTGGGWTGISKDFLTEVLGAGRDAKIHNLPSGAGAALGMMCLGLAS